MRHVSIVSMRLSIYEFAGKDVLAGAANGALLLPKIIKATAHLTAPTLVLLDFTGVLVATGSYLRESVFSFRDRCRRAQPNLCPVVVNASHEVTEELQDVLARRRDALVVCKLGRGEVIKESQVLGLLEEKQLTTLKAVSRAGETDAGALAEEFKETDPIGVTGWNNRLAGLVSKGILLELKSGRAKRYRPVVEGLEYGS